MKVYIGFDDTDTMDSPFGTGKLVRHFAARLPEGCACQGVVRQQLLVSPDIPYTSHNSSACLLVEAADPLLIHKVMEMAIAYLEDQAAEGSDPGLCLARETDPAMPDLMAFGHACTHSVVSQAQAMRAAGSAHLSGHGGTRDGIIGAAAAVGLTAAGWTGRYIEYGQLRDAPQAMRVSELLARRIAVVSIDRDAPSPRPGDMVLTNGWLRPRRMAHEPVLLVHRKEDGLWQNIYAKNNRKKAETAALSQ